MKRNRRVLWPALAIACLITALTFAASGKLRSAYTKDSNTVSGPARVKRGAYIRASALPPKLVWHLKAMGDRLEKPGRERLAVTGTLTRANDSQAEEVIALSEFPERLRLTIQRGNQTRVITFDGEADSSLDTAEQDLIETLVYGTAEHFFNTQMQGMATRLLGSRFLLHRGSTADYNGPSYDVYKVADQVKTTIDQGERVKLYYFNSDTLLLERVTYEITRNGSTVKVEERLGDWTREEGQQVARRIERLENGESVFVLTVRTARFTPQEF
ncbi:MAG TPA: hypothetical protein VKB05_10630 [Pyrinomonadaceae bacterium]|nr:hypothetical protein [Pyrinomonadaceae bacterium]